MELVKKEKQEPLRKGDELDKLAESRLLSQQELDFKQCIKERLAHILRQEEIKWFQRAKTRDLLGGDATQNISRWWPMDKEEKQEFLG